MAQVSTEGIKDRAAMILTRKHSNSFCTNAPGFLSHLPDESSHCEGRILRKAYSHASISHLLRGCAFPHLVHYDSQATDGDKMPIRFSSRSSLAALQTLQGREALFR